MYRLIFQNREAFTGRDAPVALGRDASCAVRLADAGVSDRHAQIERRADGYYLRDLDSANGVRVNGQRVTEQRLTSNDEIELGSVGFKFEIVHEPSPERRAFDPWQAAAVAVVAVLVAGQIGLFAWILSRPHPRKARTDVVRGYRAQEREARAASNAIPANLPPLPATGLVPAPAAPAEALNKMLRIMRVDRSELGDGVTLRLQIKAQINELHLDPGGIGISVQFFSPPARPGPVAWLNVPGDWENFSTRAFTAKSSGPCAGYVVRTYYRKKLQDVSASPASLAQTP
jgi:hypothetical protein